MYTMVIFYYLDIEKRKTDLYTQLNPNVMFLLSRLLLLTLFPGFAQAQDLQLIWEKRYGGAKDDQIVKIAELTDARIVAIGTTYAEGNNDTDGWLVSLDPKTGELKEQRRFGGNKDDAFYDLCQTFDGGLLLAGQTNSKVELGANDAWLIKLDHWGKLVWEKVYGSTGADVFKAIGILQNGKTILTGYRDDKKEADIWLTCVDEEGNAAWEKFYGHEEYANVEGLLISTDNHILLYGATAKKSREGN